MNINLIYRSAVNIAGFLRVAERDLVVISDALDQLSAGDVGKTTKMGAAMDLAGTIESVLNDMQHGFEQIIAAGEDAARESTSPDEATILADLREQAKNAGQLHSQAVSLRALLQTMADEAEDAHDARAIQAFDSLNVSRQATQLVGFAALTVEVIEQIRR